MYVFLLLVTSLAAFLIISKKFCISSYLIKVKKVKGWSGRFKVNIQKQLVVNGE